MNRLYFGLILAGIAVYVWSQWRRHPLPPPPPSAPLTVWSDDELADLRGLAATPVDRVFPVPDRLPRNGGLRHRQAAARYAHDVQRFER